MILFGTDIYHGNRVTSFDQIAQSVDWIALKATEGDNFADDQYPTRVREFLKRAHDPAFRLRYVLSTHWVTPMSSNRGSYLDQAKWFLAHMDHTTGSMLDSEQAGVTAIGNRQWSNVVEQELQRNVSIYSGAVNTGAGYAGYSIWRDTALFIPGRARILAAYTSEAKARALSAPFSFDAWQFSDNQTIPGFPNPVDGDHIYNPLIFDRICGLDQFVPPVIPIPAPPSPTNPVKDDDTVYTILSAPNKGAALLTLKVQADGVPRYVVKGFDIAAGETVKVWQATPGIGNLPVSDTDFDDIVANAAGPV